ncbi:alpha/beta hydrolase family protein [Myroides odoratimimus]|uniref:alpha/beta hydrolase family protein n=1 Tax=Myroides odoratimimus TaxID=76832 RepID=UPI003100FC1A
MRWKILATIFTTFLIIFLYFFFLGSQDFDDTTIQQKKVVFISQGEELSATLYLPKKEFFKTAPVAIFIHGDGPQNKTSNSTYLPLIHHLVDQGIAVFTWDKKGVDKSKGNWLHQSITDRAIEAKDAFDYLVNEKGISSDRIGYLGFSQGGWVIPKAAIMNNPAFSVIIGGAVNWEDQSNYFNQKKLELEGLEYENIKHKVDSTINADQQLYSDFNKCLIKSSEIDIDRLSFIARNFKADSSIDLQNMQGPLLALWGSEDLTVDAESNADLYRQNTALRNNKDTKLKVYPKSTHNLLNSKAFNYQLDSQWPQWKKWLFVFQGRKAYSKNVLFDISNFILKTNKKTE